MTAATTNIPAHTHQEGFFTRTERWLDERGKMAWIGAIVLGFIFFWPVGLALLGYALFFRKGNKAMMNQNCAMRMRRGTRRSSGNTAFDAYKADTLRRLEEEQDNFEAFLARLRDAKDKAEFDQFMEDRARQANHDDEPKNDVA